MSVKLGILEAKRVFYQNTGCQMREIRIDRDAFIVLLGEVRQILPVIDDLHWIEVDGVRVSVP